MAQFTRLFSYFLLPTIGDSSKRLYGGQFGGVLGLFSRFLRRFLVDGDFSMFRKYVSKLVVKSESKKPGGRWLTELIKASENKMGRASERRFFDPREEQAYRSNQAKSRMQARFHQSF
jgi:hypothetical protein